MNIYIPLRVKFLTLITISFFVALTAMTLSSRNLFLEDKESYLFEDMLTSVENDSEFIKLYIENKVIISKSVFSNSILKKAKDSDKRLQFPKEFFLDNSSLIDFHLYRFGNKEYLLDEEIENVGIGQFVDNSKELFAQSDKMHEFLSKVTGGQKFVDVYSPKKGIVQVRIGFYDDSTRLVGFFRYALSVHLSKINFGENYSKILMGESGRPYYTNLSTYEEQSNFNFKNFKKLAEYISVKNLNTGVKAHRIDGNKYLVAFRKFPDLKMYYASFTSEEQAFATTKILLIRMIKIAFFSFIFILFLVFVISSGFTKSLKDLIKATKEAAEGNYRNSIDYKSGDEVGVLVKNFNEMVNYVKFMTTKLTEANRNLEKKIKERTAELKLSNDFINAMINSLDQGLFVFNRKGNILPIHTKACEEFFGKGFQNQNVKSLLKFNDEEEAKMLMKAMFEEKIPFESVAKLAPSFVGGTRDEIQVENFFRGTIKYFPMRNKDGLIQFIVAVATDVSREFKAEIESEKNKGYIERVLKMIRAKNNFVTFLNELNQNLNQVKDGIKERKDIFDFDTLMRALHSIKGMAGQYDAKNLAHFVHGCESELSNFKDKGNDERTEYLPQIINNIQEMEEMVNGIKEEAKVVIGKSVIDGIIREEIERPRLQQFNELINRKLRKDHPDIIKSFESEFLKIPIKEYFLTYENLVQDLCSELGKKIKPFEFKNGDILVDKIFYKNVFSNFVHLFRNIVDHGVETPSARKEANKDDSGLIRVEFEVVNRRLELRISDDGGGINPTMIRNKLKENGASPDILGEPDELIIEHIFDSNFSTRTEVSDISGRGVGMDAVKHSILDVGGAVKVASEVGKGTTFIFRLPLE